MRWDLFCRVIDNYGDAGVCWRLARQLAHEHGLRICLWLDDLLPLARLCPEVNPALPRQEVAGVTIGQWPLAADAAPAEVVIAAFGCALPADYLQRMAAQPVAPLWINLEYLSAEAWVEGCHRLPSPHPRLPLQEIFFYPGFTPATGGLLREHGLFARLNTVRAAGPEQQSFWSALQVPPKTPHELRVSLFGYAQPHATELFRSWAEGAQAVTCLLPQGVLAEAAQSWQGQHGALRLVTVPFLPQPQYDLLLAACDLNFVRGEDSFVRAQWAQQPLVWQIYPQQEDTHLGKLEAFMHRYLAGLESPVAQAVRAFWTAWNRPAAGALNAAWPAFLAALPALRAHAGAWAQALAAQPDLAAQLVKYSAHRVK